MSSSSGKKKLIRDISANTVQTLVTQVFGLLIFYLSSRFLSKTEFGDLNWCSAVAATLLALGSLGLDLVYVKRLAAGENALTLSGIHFFHSLVSSLLLASLAFIYFFYNDLFRQQHALFLLVFMNLALANVANSFKLCLNGLEAYRRLALIAVISNALRFALLVALYLSGEFSGALVVMAFMASSAVELVISYSMVARSIASRPRPMLRLTEYRYFILKSLPQLGVVLFDSALARIDWILLGLLTSAAVTAEYSFAFRVYELSRLPLLIIAPVLLTRFSRMYATGSRPDGAQVYRIRKLLTWHIAALAILPLLLAAAWTPLMGSLTAGKYGESNVSVYLLLAVCVPLSGMINFLWTLAFVKGQLQSIFFVTMASAVVNVIANMTLIPLYGGNGAAFSFLFSAIGQLLLYLLIVRPEGFFSAIFRGFLPVIAAMFSFLVVSHYVPGVIAVVIVSLLTYLLCLVLFRIVKVGELKQVISAVRNQ